MTPLLRLFAAVLFACATQIAVAAEPPLKFGVGLFQPDRDKNDATYRPLAAYLEQRLGRKVELRTVDSWEGLAKSLANGETDIALMGPWGYVLANNEAGAQVVSTILYDGKPEYYAIMITHPDSGIRSPADLKGRSFAFGDKGSTSGYLIPLHYFMTQGINPDKHFSRVLHTRHQAIETQVTQGAAGCRRRLQPQPQRDDRAGPDQGRTLGGDLAVGAVAERCLRGQPRCTRDKAFVARLQQALAGVGAALPAQPALLPAHYTGFVSRDNSFYKPIRDAGLATGKLQPKRQP
jgi:phosphonate transport system substrate-binding protein